MDFDPGCKKTNGTLALALTDLILNIFVLLLDLKFLLYLGSEMTIFMIVGILRFNEGDDPKKKLYCIYVAVGQKRSTVAQVTIQII
jgi:hypothetical protein